MSTKKMNPDALVLLKMQLIFAIRSIEDKIYHENPFDGKMNFSNCKCLQFKEIYNLIAKANKKLTERGEEEVLIKPLNNSLIYPNQITKGGVWQSFIFKNEFQKDNLKELVCSFESNISQDNQLLEKRILDWKLFPDDIVLIWNENIADWEIANHKINPWKKSPCMCPLGEKNCHIWQKIQRAYFREEYEELEKLINEI